jgi:dihydrofolate reductase
MTEDMSIGSKNRLLLSIPPDMQHFKKLTTGHLVVMGRNTYLSLPYKKPLADRVNIIISTTMQDAPEGFTLYNSVDSFMEYYNFMNTSNPGSNDEVFIIGGAQIYDAFMPYVNKLYVTLLCKNSSDILAPYPSSDNKVVQFPKSLFDYEWITKECESNVYVSREYGFIEYKFLTLIKK